MTTRPDTWPTHWPSDDELLGRAVVNACANAPQYDRWRLVALTFNVGLGVAQALVERYVDENGDLKR